MEEEKAVAFYDELTRKGGGAARYKQGLGFNAANSSSSSPSFLTSFVRASSPTHTDKLEKQALFESIQNKLKKKPEQHKHHSRDIRESSRRNRSRSRERDDHSRKRSRSRERGRDRRRRRSGSASPRRERRSKRSVSPRERRSTERIGGAAADYSRLIEGYDKMTPAERVKAKMKLQLAETAEKDETKGSGWERFEFDKDAPLDDEEIEAAEDDAALVKHVGQSFRFTAVEGRREEQIRDAHDEAMFGTPVRPISTATSESEPESDLNKKENNESGPITNLISEKVLAKQQGSWRDRARKV